MCNSKEFYKIPNGTPETEEKHLRRRSDEFEPVFNKQIGFVLITSGHLDQFKWPIAIVEIFYLYKHIGNTSAIKSISSSDRLVFKINSKTQIKLTFQKLDTTLRAEDIHQIEIKLNNEYL